MIRRIASAATLAACLAPALPVAAETVEVGFCATTVTSAAAPFAIANKMGWYKNFEVKIVALPGSTDCVKFVGVGEVRYALPSVEPVASFRLQGLSTRIFYTAYQGNIYGPAVHADSPIQAITAESLKGKTIGVASMGSAGFPVARAIAANLGLDPDRDVKIAVSGEGAQAAALLRSKQIDVLSLYDTQYVLIQNAGVPLRLLPVKEFDRFPSNGFIARDDVLEKNHAEAVAVARGYAMGTVFAIANPEAAVRINWERFPYTKPTGKDEATALKDDVKTLEARIANFKLDKAGVKRWGESSVENYQAYLDFLLKWSVIKQAVKAEDVITNALVEEANQFDIAAVQAAAKAYK
jgi:NitT/TauT family transport system substrate-binding protein